MPLQERGYSIESIVLTSAECDVLVNALANVPRTRGRAGARHLMCHPSVARLANDERLLSIAANVLGQKAASITATLFEKSEQSNWLIPWHQDTALPMAVKFQENGWGPWSRKDGVMYAHAPAQALHRVVALRIHLDASDSDNGPLRVVPGSHSFGVMTDHTVHQFVRDHDPVECIVPRGGVLVMRPLIIHASSKAQSSRPRRVLHIVYANSLDLGSGIRLQVA